MPLPRTVILFTPRAALRPEVDVSHSEYEDSGTSSACKRVARVLEMLWECRAPGSRGCSPTGRSERGNTYSKHDAMQRGRVEGCLRCLCLCQCQCLLCVCDQSRMASFFQTLAGASECPTRRYRHLQSVRHVGDHQAFREMVVGLYPMQKCLRGAAVGSSHTTSLS
jgi:hypothetical protein